MNTLEKMEAWGDRNHPRWLAVLRMLLGVILFYKGYVFMSNTDVLQEMIRNSRYGEVSFFLLHYIILAQVFGGAMILWGIGTRIAVLFQLPILLGAIIFVNTQRGIYSVMNDELWFSIIILFLLVFFFVEGSGPWSLDEMIKKDAEKNDPSYYLEHQHS